MSGSPLLFQQKVVHGDPDCIWCENGVIHTEHLKRVPPSCSCLWHDWDPKTRTYRCPEKDPRKA